MNNQQRPSEKDRREAMIRKIERDYLEAMANSNPAKAALLAAHREKLGQYHTHMFVITVLAQAHARAMEQMTEMAMRMPPPPIQLPPKEKP